MNQLSLDPNLFKNLGSVTEPVEVVDPSGRIVGLYTPVGMGVGLREPSFDEADLQARERDSVEFSTSELKAHLEKL